MASNSLPVELDRRVRAAAGHRCGYCLSPQRLVMAQLEIEHIIPRARGGSSEEFNLWLSCPLCNRAKSDRVAAVDPQTGHEARLFHPRNDVWADHFEWSSDGLRILGKSAIGRATVAALRLDSHPVALIVRSYWVQVGWHPPG